MYERFTDHTRAAMRSANERAIQLRDEYIEAEHILFALLADESNRAVEVLRRFGVDAGRVASEVEATFTVKDPPTIEPRPRWLSFLPAQKRAQTAPRHKRTAPNAKRTIERAMEQTQALRRHDSTAAKILRGAGVAAEDVRRIIAEMSDGEQ